METRTLNRLRRDHAGLDRLLAILERQSHSLEQGETPDFELMEMIVGYLSDYPEQYHHSLEELLLERLQLRYPDAAQTIRHCQLDHRRLGTLGGALLDDLGGIMAGQVLPRSQLQEQLAAYCRTYRAHLTFEQDHLFPLLESHLTPADWLEQVTRFHWRQDPLFSDPVDQRYRELRDRIRIERQTQDERTDGFCPICSTG